MLNEIPGAIDDAQAAPQGLPPEDQWPEAAKIAVQVPDGRWLFGTFKHAWPDENGGWFGMQEAGQGGYWIPTPQPQGVAPQGREWQHTLTYHSERNPEGAAGAFRMLPFTDEPVRIENGRVVDMETPDPQADEHEPPAMTFNLEEGGPDASRAHYRYGLRIALSEEDIARGYVEVTLDPYTIGELYRVGGGAREQVMKKSLRGTSKGQTETMLIDDIQAAMDRWREKVREREYLSLIRPGE